MSADAAPGAVVDPVRWDAGLGAHRVSGFAEVSAVLRGAGWSSDIRRSPLVGAELWDLPPGTLLFTDPPEHTRLRRAVGPAFTPAAVQRLRPRVAAIADAALDGLGGPGATVDVLADLGYPVALAVIVELLDVGVEGAEVFATHTPAMTRMLEVTATRAELLAGATAAAEVTVFLTPILAERAHRPGADFISALLARPELDLSEVLATCILLLAAGHETTAHLVANATLALSEAPEQVPHLLADPARAVEELLRHGGPVAASARTALTDQDLAGHPVRAGEAVLLDLRGAHRDPRRWPDPDRLDLRRDPIGQLGFGAGPHFCLGAALARLEAAETLTRLFTRHPGLRPTGPPCWRASDTFHALRELPVRL